LLYVKDAILLTTQTDINLTLEERERGVVVSNGLVILSIVMFVEPQSIPPRFREDSNDAERR
jgi:hypothetical protein